MAALNADEGSSAPHGGGQRAARQHCNNQHRNHPYNSGGTGRRRHIGNNPGRGFGPGRGYYNPGRGNSISGRIYNNRGTGYHNPTRGYNTSDNCTRDYHSTDRNPIANSGFVPTQGANSTPIAGLLLTRGGLWCRWWWPVVPLVVTCGAAGGGLWCRTPGHDIQDCWATRRTYEQSTQLRQVSFSSDAYHHACAVSTADAQLQLQSSAVYASTDLADVLAAIGTPLPYNAMPGPTAFKTDFAVDPKGHINALSCSGPKMMFNAELAVNDANLPARALVDTGATHCYIIETYLARTNPPVREQDNWLSLANGSKVIFSHFPFEYSFAARRHETLVLAIPLSCVVCLSQRKRKVSAAKESRRTSSSRIFIKRPPAYVTPNADQGQQQQQQ